jgi:hypothetical protein
MVHVRRDREGEKGMIYEGEREWNGERGRVYKRERKILRTRDCASQ